MLLADLDFEKRTSYTLSLTARDVPLDVTTKSMTASANILVQVVDVNDPPVFVGPAALSVAENAPASTLVGNVSWFDEDVNAGNAQGMACEWIQQILNASSER